MLIPRLWTRRARWKLIDVLYSGGNGGASLAIGEWDEERVLAMRWNGHSNQDNSGVGNPQSRGLPTWFILPSWASAGVLSSSVIPEAKLALARALLEG
jgi:hypothetical protein